MLLIFFSLRPSSPPQRATDYLTPRQADIYGIFCSAEIFTTSLHQGRVLFVHLLLHLSFAEMTFCQADFPVILAAQLLFVFFVLREEFAFLFQTFSRNDPPGQAPPSRGLMSYFKKDSGILPKFFAYEVGILFGSQKCRK